MTNLKTTREARVGDTVTVGSGEPDSAKVKPLPGYREVKPFVYAGFFPTSNEHYNALKETIEKTLEADTTANVGEPPSFAILASICISAAAIL